MTVIDGKYELISRLGQGGTSVVYLAKNLKTHKEVVLKIQKKRLVGQGQYREHFEKEARVALHLRHKYIVSTIATGEHEGAFYLVMEPTGGGDLKAELAQNGALSAEKAVDIAKKICIALQYAHRRNVIHRDLKPANILLNKGGEPQILDFGIADTLEEEGQPDSAEKEVLGSIYYFSPEQAKGEGVDARSDLYSLGIVLYEMVTGKVPYEGESPVSVALQHLHQQPVAPKTLAQIPESLNRIILKAIAKAPENRYQSADEFARDLARCFTQPQGDYVICKEWDEQEKVPLRKRPLFRGVLILCVSVALLGALVVLLVSMIKPSKVTETLIYMPDLFELEESEAVKRLAKLGLEPFISNVVSETVPQGCVVEQTPAAGSALKTGDPVWIKISARETAFKMPSLVGLSCAVAEEDLKELGQTNYELIYRSVAGAEANVIVAQDPAAGVTVGKDTKVTLTVNSGLSQTSGISLFKGMTIEEAIKSAEAEGYQPIFIDEGWQTKAVKTTKNSKNSSNVRPGTVTGQLPEAGGKMIPGQALTLTVTPRGEAGVEGIFVIDQELWQKESEIKLTIAQTMGGVKTQVIVFLDTLENTEALIEKYGPSISFQIYASETAEEIDTEAILYVDGIAKLTRSIQLTEIKK